MPDLYAFTSVHPCRCRRAMHGFWGRGIGKEGFGQQRECTDWQKRAAGEKNCYSSSPMDMVDGDDNEQESPR